MSDKLIKILFYGIGFTFFEWLLLHIFYFFRNIRQKNNPPYTPNLDKPILLIGTFNIISIYVLPEEYTKAYLYVVLAILCVIEGIMVIALNGSILVNLVFYIKDKSKLLFESKQEKEERLLRTKSPYIPPTEIREENIAKDAVLLGKDSSHLCLWYIIPNTMKLEYEGDCYEGAAMIKTVYLNKETVMETERWRYYVLNDIVKIFYFDKAHDSWKEILVYNRTTGKLSRDITSFWLVAGEWLWKVKKGYEFRAFSEDT